MNEFKQNNITSTLKKKESLIVSSFKVAIGNNTFRRFLALIGVSMILYTLYRLRHAISRTYNAFAAWLNSFNLSVTDFVVITSILILFVAFCVFCIPRLIDFFRETIRRGCILSRAPLSVEEMTQIGATTQLEYCLIMACYLLYPSVLDFEELCSKRTSAKNNPLLDTDEFCYYKAIREFENDGPISPAVRQWCIDIIDEHNMLSVFKAKYQKAILYKNAEYIYSLLFPNEK